MDLGYVATQCRQMWQVIIATVFQSRWGSLCTTQTAKYLLAVLGCSRRLWNSLFGVGCADVFNFVGDFRNLTPCTSRWVLKQVWCRVWILKCYQNLLCSEWCAWWRHQMETFSASLVLCAGNSPVTGEFLAQRPVTRSFDVFFDLRLNKRLSKQWWGSWFETPSGPLWRHCNGSFVMWFSTLGEVPKWGFIGA